MKRVPWVLWTTAVLIGVSRATVAAQGAAMPCEGSVRAVELFNAGDRDAAYPLLSELSARDCAEPVVYLYLGAYERGHGQRDRAVETFLRGLAHDASNVQLLLELAVTYSWTDRLPNALATYQTVRRLDPARTAARLGEARVLGWMGRRDEAAEGFETVLRDQPDNTEALGGLAAVHLAALRPELARAYYGRVLALDPSNADAREGLRRADAARRLEMSAAVVSDFSSARPVRALGVSAAYHVTPEVRMSAGYNAATRDPILEQYDSQLRGGATAVASGLDVGLSWRVDRLSSMTTTYQIQAVPGATIRSASIQTSRTLRRRMALLGGARSSASTAGGSLLLASTGVSFSPTAETTMVVQGFFGASPTGRSTAVAGTVHFPARYGFTTSTTIGVSRDRQAAVTLSGTAAFRLAEAASVRVEGTAYRGHFSSRRVAVALTARF